MLAVWPRVTDPQRGVSVTERNLVLDGCGSDYRPLVDLLLDLGRDLRPFLAPRAGAALGATDWQALRAAQVHRIVATRYLQHEVARWAVDVWGRAWGVFEVVTAGTATTEAVTTGAVTTGAVTATTAGTAGTAGNAGKAGRPAGAVGVPAAAVPAALRTVPSWAGGPVSFAVGKRPPSTTLQALAARGRVVVQHGPPGPRWQPVERQAAIVFAALLVICSVSIWVALEKRGPGSLEQRGVGTGDGLRVEERAEAAASPVRDTMAAALTAAAADAPATGYSLVPLPAGRAGALTGGAAASIRDAGVGGRYRVEQQIRSVDGTENCDAVASALTGGRVTEEIVEHVPGARDFSISTREVRGTLGSDGYFDAGPRSGTTNNVSWRFRMRGRFTPTGFTAETETYTDATIRWGRQQTCVVTAELRATRLSAGAS